MKSFRKAVIDPATASVIVAILTIVGTVIADKETNGAITNIVYNVDGNNTNPCNDNVSKER